MTPVEDPTTLLRGNTGGRRRAWQEEAWEHYRRVGELAYFVRWRARSCSKVRLIASEINPETGEPTGGISEGNAEGQRVADVVAQIAGGPLGQAQLIKRVVEVLTVPGEVWVAILVRTVPDPLTGQQKKVEQWVPVTPKEVEQSTDGKTVLISLPDGTKHKFDKANGDGILRVWNPDPERAADPDSPVRGVLDPLREIVATTKKIRNADLSRLINNGILAVPQEASLPSAQAPTAEGSDAAPVQRRVDESLQRAIVRTASTASEEGEGSLASLVPIVVSLPGDHVDKIKHIKWSDEITPVAIQTRTDAIARLAMGLDMEPEQLLGMSKANHWSAWQLADADVQLHVSPVMETVCQAIYDGVLRTVLARLGIDPDKYVLWYDTSRLTADPDLTDEAKDAHDRGALRSEELLRIYGLPEDAGYDFATLEGWQKWAQDKVSADPSLLRELLPLLAPAVQAVEFPEPVTALPAGDGPGGDADGGEESGAQGREEPKTEGDEPVAASVNGGGREVGMAVELMVTRALELAGKRRRTRADMDRLQNVPVHETHRYMPPVGDGEVPTLIRGWDVGLDEIAVRYGLDADQMRLVVQQQARRHLTSQVVDA